MDEERKQRHFKLAATERQDDGEEDPLRLQGLGEDQLPPMRAVSQELAGIKKRLGWIDTVIVDRQVNREAKRAISDAYMQLIEAKRQELITKITLGLDESKKRALVDSLRISGEIDREIANLSGVFVTTMFQGAIAAGIAAAKEEHRKLKEIDQAYKTGEITEKRFHQLSQVAMEAATHVTEIVKDNVARIIQSHIDKVQLALELFKKRVLGEGL